MSSSGFEQNLADKLITCLFPNSSALWKSEHPSLISPKFILAKPLNKYALSSFELKIIALFKARIDTLRQQFAHYEQVKYFTWLPEPFSMEKGELTNTLKMKRSVIEANYKEVIDKMYEA